LNYGANFIPNLADAIEDSALRGILDDWVVLMESLSILDIESIEIPLRTDELQKEEVWYDFSVV
jgi:hypothetical protein